MDREEQIKQAAEQYAWVGNLYDLQSAFTVGAKWADENPKKGLVSIDDVCRWIEENIWDFPWYDPDKPLSTNDIIKELRKDLEK